jgi:hypothetical protein
MAFLEDMFKGGNILTGAAIAVGAAVLAPVIAPAVSNILRPAAKAVIKGGIMVYDQGRRAATQLSEVASDTVAEARADSQQASKPSETAGETTKAHPA